MTIAHPFRHESEVLARKPPGRSGTTGTLWVYTPPGLRRSGERYPLAVWLIGYSGAGDEVCTGNRLEPGLARAPRPADRARHAADGR